MSSACPASAELWQTKQNVRCAEKRCMPPTWDGANQFKRWWMKSRCQEDMCAGELWYSLNSSTLVNTKIAGRAWLDIHPQKGEFIWVLNGFELSWSIPISFDGSVNPNKSDAGNSAWLCLWTGLHCSPNKKNSIAADLGMGPHRTELLREVLTFHLRVHACLKLSRAWPEWFPDHAPAPHYPQ